MPLPLLHIHKGYVFLMGSVAYGLKVVYGGLVSRGLTRVYEAANGNLLGTFLRPPGDFCGSVSLIVIPMALMVNAGIMAFGVDLGNDSTTLRTTPHSNGRPAIRFPTNKIP